MTPSPPAPSPDDSGEFLLYQTEDGHTRIEVRLANETIWLPQRALAELFQTTPQNITQHIAAIYDEGELTEPATCKEFLQVRAEGARQVERSLKHYSLDVILAVGYRVRSHRGTQFRIWATERLREYLVKGFAMDDRRLKRAGGATTSKSCWPAFATSAAASGCSGGRCSTSTPPVLTTTPKPRVRCCFSRRCRTRCTGRHTGRRLPR